MILHPHYIPSDAEIDALLASQRIARLITIDDEASPRIGLYPYLGNRRAIEVHLVKQDAQARDLRARPRCLIEIDDALSFVPSHLTDESDATHADVYYRSVWLTGAATLQPESEAVADHLTRLLARYQPEGRYAPVATDHAHYAKGISQLVVVHIPIASIGAKFKLGQNVSRAHRERVAEGLEAQGDALGARTASIVRDMLGTAEAP